MTSLTPNEDRVRATCKPSKTTLDAAKEPGMRGVHARMNIALMNALMTAMAKEADRGAQTIDVIGAGAVVVGQMVASLGASLNPLDPVDGAVEILRHVADSAGHSAANIADGLHDHTMVDGVEVARA